jgi:hypothetical protein
MIVFAVQRMKLFPILIHYAQELTGFCVAFFLGQQYLILNIEIDWVAKAENLAFALFTAFVIGLIKYLFPNGIKKCATILKKLLKK